MELSKQEIHVSHVGDLSPAGSSVGMDASFPVSAAFEKTRGVLRPETLPTCLPSLPLAS